MVAADAERPRATAQDLDVAGTVGLDPDRRGDGVDVPQEGPEEQDRVGRRRRSPAYPQKLGLTSPRPASTSPGNWETHCMEFVLIAIAILVVALVVGIGLLVGRGRRAARLDDDAAAGTTLTRPAPRRLPATTERRRSSSPTAPARRRRVELPPAEPEPGLVFETPPPSAGRLVRLRSRLARSQSSLGRGLRIASGARSSPRTTGKSSRRPSSPPTSARAATLQIVERLRTQSMVLATASGRLGNCW